VSVTRGHVAGSLQKTIEGLREANAGLCRELEEAKGRAESLQDRLSACTKDYISHRNGLMEAEAEHAALKARVEAVLALAKVRHASEAYDAALRDVCRILDGKE
jgi:chromosome segregation ATPase